MIRQSKSDDRIRRDGPLQLPEDDEHWHITPSEAVIGVLVLAAALTTIVIGLILRFHQ